MLGIDVGNVVGIRLGLTDGISVGTFEG